MALVPIEPPPALRRLTARFDPAVFPTAGRTPRVRLHVTGGGPWDAVLDGDGAALELADPRAEPDAVIVADPATWDRLAREPGAGLAALGGGRLHVRRDLHLGVGFLAATAGAGAGRGLAFRAVETAAGELATMQAGAGSPVLLIHGLGATKASFLPTVAALAPRHRVVALDLPGFGDSAKPLGAAYDAAFFADAVTALLDALGHDRAALIGNSMGARVALEVAFAAPARTDRVVLLAPSLAWLRERPLAGVLRAIPPQLGLLQPAPRRLVEGLVRRLLPEAEGGGWTAAGVDEFLRSYLEPRGRAAFYAAARGIYLDEPHGPEGFWTRLRALERPSLFVWGRHDRIVPLAFARHVREALPRAQHLELDCGHVPQLERPAEVHAALRRFLAG